MEALEAQAAALEGLQRAVEEQRWHARPGGPMDAFSPPPRIGPIGNDGDYLPVRVRVRVRDSFEPGRGLEKNPRHFMNMVAVKNPRLVSIGNDVDYSPVLHGHHVHQMPWILFLLPFPARKNPAQGAFPP